MGNVRDLRDQSMFALSRLVDAEGIDRGIEIYLLLQDKDVLSLCVHPMQDNYNNTEGQEYKLST